MKKGTYVSRAAFAKMQAEKNRLLKDIKIMTMGGAEGGIVWSKWRKHFKKMDWFNDALREIAKNELPALKEKYGIKEDEFTTIPPQFVGDKSRKIKKVIH